MHMMRSGFTTVLPPEFRALPPLLIDECTCPEPSVRTFFAKLYLNGSEEYECHIDMFSMHKKPVRAAC